jgi:hypothetical protein
MNRSTHVVVLLLLVSAVVYTGCNADAESATDINVDRISTEYVLEYRKHENKTYAWAIFRFGKLYQGTPLQLGSASSITCNGVAMTYGVIPSLNLGAYSRTFTGLVDSLTFVYMDSLNRSYTNTIQYTRTIEWPSTFTSFNKDSGAVFTWVGEPIAANDSIYFWLDDSTGLTSNLAASATTVGDTSIVLPARSQLSLGNGWAASVSRLWRVPAQQAPAGGGVLRVEYDDDFTSRGGVVTIVQ